jgi:ParB family chromosome partitioning protein
MRKIVSIRGSSLPASASGSRRIENIPIHMIKPNPYQPRKSFSVHSLEELAQSIRQYGIIQPITVRSSSQSGYELIAGERRLRAAKLAGLDYIPAMIIHSCEKDSAIFAMIENLQRENLHYLEEAKGYASLIQDHGFTQEELAVKLGKSQSTIANKLRILRLSSSIKELLIRENLTERHARALLKLPDDELRLKAVRQVVAKKMNVRDTEAVIDEFLEELQDKKQRAGRKKEAQDGKRQTRVFKRTKDIRIFINTIRNAVNLLKGYGLEVQYFQVDKEDQVEITVMIPKM